MRVRSVNADIHGQAEKFSKQDRDGPGDERVLRLDEADPASAEDRATGQNIRQTL